jgi:hypothetical protein
MSALVRELAVQIKAARLPEPEFEYLFAAPRRWRFDLCWPALKLAVEVDGGVWTRGRHSRGKGMVGDMDKRNEAVARGWRVLTVTNTHISDGSALRIIEEAIERELPF